MTCILCRKGKVPAGVTAPICNACWQEVDRGFTHRKIHGDPDPDYVKAGYTSQGDYLRDRRAWQVQRTKKPDDLD